MRQRPQDQVIGVEIFRPLALDVLDLGRPEARFDRAEVISSWSTKMSSSERS
jgi:hypothetical protein